MEGEDTSGEKLTLSEISAVEETENPESAVTESQAEKEQAESKDAAVGESGQQISSHRTTILVIGAAILLAVLGIAGTIIYRKKKNMP